MNILEKIQNGINLKGHTRIILTDVRDGSQKVSEDSNMVSDAVSEVLANNFCGLGQFSQLMPLKKLFGGVMMFRDAITESGSNYNIPSDDVNPMTGHAGQTPHATASPYRGNPNGGETIATDTSIKFVWDFMTNQGNSSQISTVCLVPQGLGDMGIKPFDATQNPMFDFGHTQVYSNDTSDERLKQYPVSFGTDGKTYFACNLTGTTFKEHTMRHDLWKFGIMRDQSTWQTVATRTATVDAGLSFFFQDDDYYYVAGAESSTKLKINKISKTDFTVTSTSVTVSGVSLYSSALTDCAKWMPLFAFDGTYLYYPNSTADKFIKINITNGADVSEIDGTISINLGRMGSQAGSGQQRSTPIVLSPGIVVGDNYIINGTKAYPIKQVAGIGCQATYVAYSSWLALVRHGAACYGHALQSYTSSSAWTGQACVLFPYMLNTINVLQDPVEKSTAQTMKVEYTLTEA